MLHETLHRQLIKVFGSEEQIPKDLDPLFQIISDTYLHSDEDRDLTVRSLEISSRELENLNIQLASEGKIIEKEVEKRTEELSAERNKLSLILSGIVDCVIAVDMEKRIILFNKAAEHVTGYTITEVLGKQLSEIIKVFDNDTEVPSSIYCSIRADNFEGIIYSKTGLKLLGSKGKQTYINLLAGQIKECRSVNLGCILTLHDVSAEKQLDEMKLDFISMAAHELRTPLTAIRGYAELLLNNNKNPENDETLRRLTSSSENLSGLIDNLLNASRIEKGKMTIDTVPTNLGNLIKEVIDSLIDQIKLKEQTVQTKGFDQSYPMVLVDPIRIREVVTNLLANALNYTQAKGTITISMGTKHEHDGDYSLVSVSDTGTGIPPEALPHLFTKFYRVHGSLEMGSKGTGLGLYISKSIIDLHSGKIWATSELGRGSTFTFELPIHSAEVIKKHQDIQKDNLLSQHHGIILNPNRNKNIPL